MEISLFDTPPPRAIIIIRKNLLAKMPASPEFPRRKIRQSRAEAPNSLFERFSDVQKLQIYFLNHLQACRSSKFTF